MAEYWQKKPLLVRNAIPAFALEKAKGSPLESPMSAEELINLAAQDGVESRLVQAKPWRLGHGPFNTRSIPKPSKKDWTILVQGMEAHHPAAKTILSWFRFIPDSRLDDLMISLAGPNGGVGPHLDSYDVFLLQMSGRRHWRISEQKDHTLLDGLPLKILKNFQCEHEWVLEPGDLLYLPPKVAHDGIALDPGTQTWSVGFRSPSWKELLQEALWKLADSLDDLPELNQLMSDPTQIATSSPANLPELTVNEFKKQFNKLPLKGKLISDLLEATLCESLSEPKPHIVFSSPNKPLSPKQFKTACEQSGISPNSQTRFLIYKQVVYCNGEFLVAKKESPVVFQYFQLLAQQKFLSPLQCKNELSDPDLVDRLYEMYEDGWLEIGAKEL